MSRVAAAAALVAPCAAFVPGNLRAGSQNLPREVVEGQTEAIRPAAAAAAAAATAGGFAPSSVAALGFASAALAAGAVHVSSRSRQRCQAVGRRVVGVCLPLTEKFDPLNLGCTDAKMDRYSAVEIKHGRVAMLACIGYVMPEIFRFPGCETFENGLDAFDTLPAEGWIQLVAFLGAHELFVKPRKNGMGPSDFGLGTEVLEGLSAAELEYRQTAERNNGRLAMVAIMGLMVQDGMFGKTPLEMIKSDGFWGPSVDFLVKDIPICNGLCAEEPKMSPSVPYLEYPKVLDGWVGGEKGFDPLQVTDALPVYLVREAELKHGRVCMLATVGWIATDLGVRFPGEVFQNVSSTVEAHDKMVEAGIMGPFLASIAVAEIYAGWLCLEGFSGKINRAAGDFFLGKNFLPKDETSAATMKLKELENGRLAMVAFSGICTQAVLTDKPWPFL